jgi:hypothetical protein
VQIATEQLQCFICNMLASALADKANIVRRHYSLHERHAARRHLLFVMHLASAVAAAAAAATAPAPLSSQMRSPSRTTSKRAKVEMDAIEWSP